MPRIHASHWRARALEMRLLADLTAESAVREAMLKVAEQYDNLAKQSGEAPAKPVPEGAPDRDGKR